MTLESQISKAAIAVPQPMPFAVDFKEGTRDRLYRHVAFPGIEGGVYRIRTVNTGRKTESTVVQGHVDTALPIQTVEGEIFRIKAVLDAPDNGVTESYWLTLSQSQTDLIQRLNQYRLRGVALEGWRSDWVYSELRTDENELVIYDLLYDILDLVLTTRDSEVNALLTMMTSDAYKLLTLNERAVASFTKSAEELLSHGVIEELQASGKTSWNHEEIVSAKLQELFQQIGKHLNKEFTESFMASQKEFTEILKLYRFSEKYSHDCSDLATLVFQAFLEERIEKVVQKATIEVFAENEGNHQFYLEGEFELDVRAEMLRSAYDLMLTDRFFTNIDSTVQLILGPVATEFFPYEQVENIRKQARFFRNEITELAETIPVEQLELFMRLVIDDLYLPYLLIDQRLLQVSIDLKDHTNLGSKDSIVEFDLETPEGFIRHMLVRDIIESVVSSDEMRYFVYGQLVERLISTMDERHTLAVDYYFEEFFDSLSVLGEHVESRYRNLAKSIHESDSVHLKDDTLFESDSSILNMEAIHASLFEEGLFSANPSPRFTESLTFEIQDGAFVDPLLQSYVSDTISLLTLDQSAVSIDAAKSSNEELHVQHADSADLSVEVAMQQRESFIADVSSEFRLLMANRIAVDDQIGFDAIDKAKLSGKGRISYDEMLGFDAGSRISLREAIKIACSEVMKTDPIERVRRDQKLSRGYVEGLTVSTSSLLSPLYRLHLFESYHRPYPDKRKVQLDTQLYDRYEMKGREIVRYMLGDVSQDGWPVGKFILGLNTLK